MHLKFKVLIKWMGTVKKCMFFFFVIEAVNKSHEKKNKTNNVSLLSNFLTGY